MITDDDAVSGGDVMASCPQYFSDFAASFAPDDDF
jgi:hypothetical protein